MQTDLGIIIVMFIIFASCAIMVKQIIHGSIWKKLIENNMIREGIKLPDLATFDKLSWLKWGIVIIAFSIAIIIVNVIPIELSDEIKMGITGIIVGAAFIISYFISDNSAKNIKE